MMRFEKNKKAEKLTIDKVREMVLQSMTEQDRAHKPFYIDQVIHPEGKELVIGKNRYRMTSDTIVVFVDDEPGKNWAHDCHYLFFDVQTGEVKEIPERFPPSLNDIPGTFRLIWKPEGIPSWALWFDE
jgi:hypothetical protein